ncbi:MAG TPA: flagellar basal-body rod protein FlgF [Clostridia bacterium]|nr:flagellar basal-body rod protein FlgF [Clostridia bacterium]
MDSGYYAACTGLIARTEALEIAANNLANANTSGFRAKHETFHSLLAQSTGTRLTDINRAVNDYGVLGSARVDLSQGNLERTGNVLDLAIEGRGFFAVQTAGGTRYTRDGSFQQTRDGYLVTNGGDRVLGENGAAIRMLDGTADISGEGTISVSGALAGKLKIVEFVPGTQLESVGDSYYSAPSNSVVAPSASRVRQGMVEGSNVNPVASAVGLIALQRHAEMLQRALSTFHSEFNRIAAEELPRV